MAQKIPTYVPMLRNADPSVSDAIRLLYEAVSTLSGRKGPIVLEDTVRAQAPILATNNAEPAKQELLTRGYADAHFGPKSISHALSSQGTSPLDLTALPGYASARFDYGVTAARPTRGSVDGQIWHDTTAGSVYRWNENTQTWDLISGTGTNQLLDGSIHNDTTNSAVVSGDIIYGNATPKWTRLPKGTDGQVLTLAAGLPSWGAGGAAASGWTDDGTVVRLTTATDQVAIGINVPTNAGPLEVRQDTASNWMISTRANSADNSSGFWQDASKNVQMALRNGAAVLKVVIDSAGSGTFPTSYIKSGGLDVAGGYLRALDDGSNNAPSTGKGLEIIGTSSAGYITSFNRGTSVYQPLNINGSQIQLGADNAAPIIIGGAATASELRFLEPSGSGVNYTGFKAPALAADVIYVLPIADGTAGQFLKTDGLKNLSWATESASLWNRGGTPLGTQLTNTSDAVRIAGDLQNLASGTLSLVTNITAVIMPPGDATTPGMSFNVSPKFGFFYGSQQIGISMSAAQAWHWENGGDFRMDAAGKYLELLGNSAGPGAPSANACRLTVDNLGAGGKHRLLATFGTGASQVLATEP